MGAWEEGKKRSQSVGFFCAKGDEKFPPEQLWNTEDKQRAELERCWMLGWPGQITELLVLRTWL